MSLELMAERTAELFAKCFGQLPKWMVAAPGRVNLIGEHTDYNDGFVLPMAIDRYTLISGGAASGQQVTLHNVTTGDTAKFLVRPPIKPGEPAWSNYVRGVVSGMSGANRKVKTFNAVIDSEVPMGGGLASSAALEVATATLLEALGGFRLAPREKALLCQTAEHEFAGVPCGIMDQFSSVLAEQDNALLIDCRSRAVKPVKMKDPNVTVLIINTRLRHKNAESGYAERRAQCLEASRILGVPALRDATLPMLNAAQARLGTVLHRRARHVILENERTLQAAAAMQDSDWATVGNHMYSSHESLRDDFEVSTKELDIVVESGREIGFDGGVIGCRMTGGGFGGCAVSLVRTDVLQQVTRKFADDYEKRTGEAAEIFGYHQIEPSPENFARFFKDYAKRLQRILQQKEVTVCPGVREFIQHARQRTQPPILGLLTGNVRIGAELKLKHVGLWDIFTTGGFADDHEERDHIAAIARMRGTALAGQSLEDHEILVIGDTPLDIRCARAIGARVLAVGTGGASMEELEQHRPDYLARDLSIFEYRWLNGP